MKKTILSLTISIFVAFFTSAQESGLLAYNNINTNLSESSNNAPVNLHSLSSNSASTASSSYDDGNWQFGGGFGMSFTGDYNSINISPQIGYRFNRYIALGGGISYNYYENKNYDATVNYLGLNLYARFYPISYFMVYAQPEVLRRWGHVGARDRGSEVFSSVLIGAGLSIPVAPRSSLIVSLYYDVVQDVNTPYGDKIGYSIGYGFSF